MQIDEAENMRPMNSTPNIFIHIGPGKTATSFLQARIFRNHSQINYLGKNHADPQINHRLSGLIRSRRLRFPEAATRAAFNAAITAHPEKKVHLLSEELLGTWRFNQAPLIAKRLYKVFGPATVHIAVRNTVDWLQSVYFWCMQQNRFHAAEWEFEDWVGYWINQPLLGNPLSALHTRRLAKAYAAVFGKSNIRFIVYEDLKRDPVGFARAFAEEAGIDSDEMERTVSAAGRQKGEKSRISQHEADYLRTFSLAAQGQTAALADYLFGHLEAYGVQTDKDELTPRLSALGDGRITDPTEQYHLFKAVYAQTRKQMPEGPRAAATLSPEMEAKLRGTIGSQLRWVQSKYGVDLKARGYAFDDRTWFGKWRLPA